MKYRKLTITAYLLLLILISPTASCTGASGGTINYDPSKNYAAFLVLNTESGKSALENMKLQSTADNYTIGPIEYYSPGSTGYEPLIRKLIQNKQVTLLWLIAPMREIIEMQKVITKVEYKGAVRYLPVLPSYSQ
ncbi:MAG: hypothetical protein NT082_06740 [Chloroflexi bacterium]|nr:hypothetical protein [Chloroflexota bacterium]